MSAAVEERYAFFDVDGTLLRIATMFRFERFALEEAGPLRRALGRLVLERCLSRLPRAWANRLFYLRYAGRRPADVRRAVDRWARTLDDGIFIGPVVAALEDLRRRGVEPVLVSGSSREILRPIARRLGVDHVLATRVEVRAGIYTGRILPPQTIGAGKLRAAQAFLERTGANAGRCYAFGDHLSDLPLLEAVGHPRVVAGDPRLERQAHRRGWPVVPTR